jgi:ABC-2 type transport system ATP-binding protein
MVAESLASPAVDIEGVSFLYNKLKAVDGLSLRIPRGVSYGLLGPNGAGKTTLIRLMAGLLSPQAGRLQIMGLAPSRRTAHLLGYMPQLPSLYNELSVAQNIAFFATVGGLSDTKERNRRVDEVIRLVELWEKRGESVYNLSGGMKQRVSLACAIVHDPPLLLLDEPTVGLDPELRCVFWRYFQDLTKQGRTLIISSHTMDDAAHCDTLAFMRQGQVIAIGSPEELRRATGRAEANLEDAFLHFIHSGAPCA